MAILTVEQFSIADLERFWSKVDRSAGDGECWLWTGKPNHDGYGVTRSKLGGAKWKNSLVHRFSWVSINGEIPSHLRVLHRCDVRSCVNPSHLFLGTQTENVADMVAKGRQHKGSGVSKAVLSEEKVLLIKDLVGTKSEAEIAREFGVSPGAIRDIAVGDTWKHVGEDVSGRPKFGARGKILPEEKVREIRAFAKQTSVKQAATKYQMKYKVMWQITSGRSYKNII